MPREQVQITSINAGFAPTQDFGPEGSYQFGLGIDPDYSLTPTMYRKSAALVPTRYEKFSSSVITGAPSWIMTNPKNTNIYVYSKDPTGSAAEISTLNLATDVNLKAYYKMSTGALTTDSSGASKTLTNNNTVTENASGKFGYCADFGTANSNKSFSIADALSYAGGAYSITMWTKIQTELTTDGDGYILARIAEATTNTMLIIEYKQENSVKKLVFQRVAYGSSVKEASYPVTLGIASWHHIVGTYDGTNLHIYVDNVDSGAVAASGSGSSALSDKFSIGAP